MTRNTAKLICDMANPIVGIFNYELVYMSFRKEFEIWARDKTRPRSPMKKLF